MFKKSKGFTLIELLVVIAIIGILASVVLASMNRARQQARDARRVSDIKQLQLALELYFDTNREYAPSLAALATGGHIPAIPVDPIASAPYLYNILCAPVAADPTTYHIGANLELASTAALAADLDAKPCVASTIDSPDADGCSDETGRYCYDLVP